MRPFRADISSNERVLIIQCSRAKHTNITVCDWLFCLQREKYVKNFSFYVDTRFFTLKSRSDVSGKSQCESLKKDYLFVRLHNKNENYFLITLYFFRLNECVFCHIFAPTLSSQLPSKVINSPRRTHCKPLMGRHTKYLMNFYEGVTVL